MFQHVCKCVASIHEMFDFPLISFLIIIVYLHLNPLLPSSSVRRYACWIIVCLYSSCEPAIISSFLVIVKYSDIRFRFDVLNLFPSSEHARQLVSDGQCRGVDVADQQRVQGGHRARPRAEDAEEVTRAAHAHAAPAHGTSECVLGTVRCLVATVPCGLVPRSVIYDELWL